MNAKSTSRNDDLGHAGHLARTDAAMNSNDDANATLNCPDSDWTIQTSDEGIVSACDTMLGSKPSFDDLASAVERVIADSRNAAFRQVNRTQLLAYWNIGRMVVVYEQHGSDRAEYGATTINRLSKVMTAKLGRGFSRSNVYNMRSLYLKHRDIKTLSGELSWTHYCELLDVQDDEKRLFYEREAANARWSVRELRRQMNSMLFERVLRAKDDAQRSDVLSLASEGLTYQKAADAIKDPYVLEFLDLPDGQVPLESDLQRSLVAQIEKFMLELGRGFMFVGSNQRVPVGPDIDYVDMVFYCKPLRAYVLIELKTDRLRSSAIGQVNEYLNYYATEVNDEFDNPPIGIILCTDKNSVRAQYALGGLSNAIFASTYTLTLPNEEQLEEQVRRTLAANELASFDD